MADVSTNTTGQVAIRCRWCTKDIEGACVRVDNPACLDHWFHLNCMQEATGSTTFWCPSCTRRGPSLKSGVAQLKWIVVEESLEQAEAPNQPAESTDATEDNTEPISSTPENQIMLTPASTKPPGPKKPCARRSYFGHKGLNQSSVFGDEADTNQKGTSPLSTPRKKSKLISRACPRMAKSAPSTSASVRVNSPEKSPPKAPLQSPAKSPQKASANSPASSNAKSPPKNPLQSPANSPAKSTTNSPVNSPAKSSANSPANLLANSPSQSAGSSSGRSPSNSPSRSSAHSPSTSQAFSSSNTRRSTNKKRSKRRQEVITCKKCNVSFKRTTYYRHLKKPPCGQLKLFKCQTCGKQFKRKDYLSAHSKKH